MSDRWTTPITEGLKVRDLPDVMRCAFEHIEGAQPAVAYKGGSFYAVEWVQEHPLHWPKRVETKANVGDEIVLRQDWGVEIRFKGNKNG